MKYKHLILSLSLIMLGPLAHAEEIGSVDTVFKMIGPDHKIVVEAFDDPEWGALDELIKPEAGEAATEH